MKKQPENHKIRPPLAALFAIREGEGNMNIRAFGCPETFLAHTKADLLKNEAVNSPPLGILYALRRNNGSADILLTAENESGL
ncbi:hypothetical protein [Bacillus haynesii]|uniref:hypothetical protein n=1 Tax=Bacillus haynesii TaxID=1925021 RepID=UPI0005C6D105|nr:hypothetical protein [Bacillus haynesii]